MKKLLSLVTGFTILLLSCSDNKKFSEEEKIQNKIDLQKTNEEIDILTMQNIIRVAGLKADGVELDPRLAEVLIEGDSTAVNCFIQHRKAAIEKKKLEKELRLKKAEGTNQETILNYKARISGLDKKIADLRYNHYKLYDSKYWDESLIRQYEY